jgi:DNA-binding NarL/FixJ family response regulator
VDLDTFQAADEIGCLVYVLKPRLCTGLVPAVNLALSGARFVSPGVEKPPSSE